MSVGRALATGRTDAMPFLAPAPLVRSASLALKIGVLAMLVLGFLMVPTLQERGLSRQAAVGQSGPLADAANGLAQQQAVLLTKRP